MPVWLLVIFFAAIRAIYSALVEAYITWGFAELFLPGEYKISYLVFFGIWYIIGFVVACFRLRKLFRD
jgi:hypothetical protein